MTMPNDWYLSNKTHSSSFVLSTWNIKIIIERNCSLQNKCIWHDKCITPFLCMTLTWNCRRRLKTQKWILMSKLIERFLRTKFKINDKFLSQILKKIHAKSVFWIRTYLSYRASIISNVNVLVKVPEWGPY